MMVNKQYIIILVIFIVTVYIVGVFSAKKTNSDADWLIGGQSLGIIPSVGTYFATIISSVTVISYVGYIYLNGVSGVWIFSGTFLTSILSVIYYAKHLRRTGNVSLPDYLDKRFGKMEGICGAILILISSIFTLCTQIVAGVSVLRIISNLPVLSCTLLLCILLILLTNAGGMISVAWTDTFCAMVMIVGVWAMAVSLLYRGGGVAVLAKELFETNPVNLDLTGIGIPMILSWIFTWGIGNFGVPQFVTRLFTAKDERTAQRSQLICVICFLVFFTPIAIIGLSGIIMNPGITKQDEVTFTMIRYYLTPVSGGVMLAAILSCCISTADSILLLASVTVTNDIYKKVFHPQADSHRILFVSRTTTWCVGVLAMMASLIQNGAILWLQARMVTLMGAAMAPSVLIGLAWKGANRCGGMCSFLTGLVTALIWYEAGQPFGIMPMLPAFLIGSLFMVVGSCIYERGNRRLNRC